MHTVYLQLGSNLGDRVAYLTESKALIGARIGRIVSLSDIFESEPWGFFASNWFLNQVVCIETASPPQDILHTIHGIESEMGRKRVGKSYTSRTIDIDILIIDNLAIDSPTLTVPHPRLHERLFVLLPLAQIAPKLVHPILGATIEKLLNGCTDELEVRKWAEGSDSKEKGWCRV